VEEFASTTLEFANTTLEFANTTLEFASTTLEFASTTLEFANTTLEFANTTLEFASTSLVGLLLDEFSKLRKATVGFIMSVCLSFRMEQLGFHWRNLYEI
jgi:hypothetical protein